MSASTEVIDFSAVMKRMHRLRAQISHHDSAHRFRELEVDGSIGTRSSSAEGKCADDPLVHL